VLPFATKGSDGHFAEGITRELIGILSRTEGIDVIAPESALACSGDMPAPEVADRLGVDVVLRGSAERSGADLRITADLSEVASDSALWSTDLTASIADLFSIQLDIARGVARALGSTLVGDEEELIHREPTSDLGAYDAYLKGRHDMALQSETGRRSAISHFETAIERDSLFASAWSALAECYSVVLTDHSSSGTLEAASGARSAATRALELDSQMVAPLVSLGYVELDAWNWPRAEAHFRRALAAAPSHAGAHRGYSRYLLHTGDFAGAIASAERAFALDPLSDAVMNESGVPYAYAGRVHEARERARHVVGRDPENITAYFNLGCYATVAEKHGEAVTYFRAAAELSTRMPFVTGYLGMALAGFGDSDEAEDIAHDLGRKARRGSRIATCLAALLIRLGRPDEGLTWLETALESREPLLISADTHWLPLPEVRDHPRFKAVLARLPQPCAAGRRP